MILHLLKVTGFDIKLRNEAGSSTLNTNPINYRHPFYRFRLACRRGQFGPQAGPAKCLHHILIPITQTSSTCSKLPFQALNFS